MMTKKLRNKTVHLAPQIIGIIQLLIKNNEYNLDNFKNSEMSL